MFSTPVKELMDSHKLLLATPQTSVRKASESMAKHGVGAVLVVEGKHLLGIFTERDVVFRVVAQGLDTATTRVTDVMTPEPEDDRSRQVLRRRHGS